jgi:hypothetical protein
MVIARRRKKLPLRHADKRAEAARRTHWHEAIEHFLSAAHLSRSSEAGAIIEGMLLLAVEEHDAISDCWISGELSDLIARGAARQCIEIPPDELPKVNSAVRSALTPLRKAAENEVEVEFHGDTNAVMLEVVTPGPRGRKRGTYTLRMRLSRESFADPSVYEAKRIQEALYDAIQDADFFTVVLPVDALGHFGVDIVRAILGDYPPTAANVRPFIRGVAKTLADFFADRFAHLGVSETLAVIQRIFGVDIDVENLRTADFYPSMLRSILLPRAKDRLLALVVARLPVLNVVEKLYCIQLMRAFADQQNPMPSSVRALLDYLTLHADAEDRPFVGSLRPDATDLEDVLARAVDHHKAREKLRRKLEEVRQNPRVP